MTRRIQTLALLALLAVMTAACSEEDPSIRVRNDLDKKVNVQFKPNAGSTININDVEAGATTGYQNVQEGTWTATASIQSVSVAPEAVFTTENDMNYTIVIVNTDPPTMDVQSEDK